MDAEDKEAALCYWTHASALKKAGFIHTDLAEEVQVGHVAISPLETVNVLQNLRLSLVAVNNRTKKNSNRKETTKHC